MTTWFTWYIGYITTSCTDTAPARLTSSSSSAHRPPRRHVYIHHLYSYACKYTSRSTAALVRLCVSMYTVEHRRPRSPMCTNIYTAEWSTATLVTPPFLSSSSCPWPSSAPARGEFSSLGFRGNEKTTLATTIAILPYLSSLSRFKPSVGS